MTSGAFIAAGLLCTFTLDAQIVGTLSVSPSGRDEVKIRNQGSVSVVAFAVTMRQTPTSPAASTAPAVVYSDALIDASFRPLLPNDERVVVSSGAVVRGPTPIRVHLLEPIVAAGIYSDGSTTGDEALLARLISRRSNMLLAIETTIDILMDAGRRNLSREFLVSRFQSLASILNRGYLSPEQQVGRSLYQAMTGKLMNLPEQEAGAAFPPAVFVQSETAALNRQRVALLESQPNLIDRALVTRHIVD